MTRPTRPLSPHLGIYKWQLHMAMSILHRATGVFLGFGLIGMAWWLLAIAEGPDAYNQFIACASSLFGRLVLLGFSYSLVYHALNGMRHLLWDTGRGLDVESVRKSGLVTMVLSILLTVAVWFYGYSVLGQF